MTSWHDSAVEQVATMLTTDPGKGLLPDDARSRLARYGPNRLQEAVGRTLWAMFADQFREFMVLILLAATVVSLLLGEYLDAGVIMGIIVANAILGFIQEMKAERSLEALQVLSAPRATVIRGGWPLNVPAEQVVPGDLLVVESGTRVAADARVVTAAGLEAEESSLTGESTPVSKSPAPVSDPGAQVADQTSMLFAATTVTRGRGTAIVVTTGMDTQVGLIAGLLAEPQRDRTPLQKRLEMLGRQLVAASVVVVGLVVVTGIARGESVVNMFLAGVSLAVAAVPEGLPAVVTISLALGVQRMSRKHAIVRRLPAVETLGCATIIGTDKTGTVTVNQMTVREMWAGDVEWLVEGEGYGPSGTIQSADGRRLGSIVGSEWQSAIGSTLAAGALCNNAELIPPGQADGARGQRSGKMGWTIQGDPTEGALVVAAAKVGLWRNELGGKLPRLAEIPFESDRRLMTVVVDAGTERRSLVKGAPDAVLSRCRSYLDAAGRELPLTDEVRERVSAAEERMGDEALRVLAVAGRTLPLGGTWSEAEAESELVLFGLAGMIDPPRPEVRLAVDRCRSAGIRVCLITGDHASTARAVAREVGIADADAEVLLGRDIERMSDQELGEACTSIDVFARVSPQHKLRIVRALRRAGHVVAMTGDGVNDGPAVREADIGVAMGRSGTDVTRETSDIILADDNFATIVAAVEEGRGIYDNIRRFIRYLLSCNVGEIVIMFGATLGGLPLPLLPTQILLLNLVTDGLPATALGLERADHGVMQRPPRDPRANVFSGGLGWRILSRGLVIGLVSLGVFWMGLRHTGDLTLARTMAFSTLVVSQLVFVFVVRGPSHRGWSRLFGNRYLVAAVLSSFAVLLAVVYIPVLQPAFRTAGLGGTEWLLVAGASLFAAVFAVSQNGAERDGDSGNRGRGSR